jgi:hypothetical protein
VQEGRRQKAAERSKESLCNKLFNLFQLDSYFRQAALDICFPKNQSDNELIDKTLVIFLGCLKQDVTITLSSHESYTWIQWNPPHAIEPNVIDPLLKYLEQYFYENWFGI